MNQYRFCRRALWFILLCLLSACGDGGGAGSPSASVTLKLATTGTPSQNLAGVDITVTLPDGVAPALKNDGTVADTVVTVSGVAGPGIGLTPVYTVATATTPGTLRVYIASSLTAGFGAGEFATVQLGIVTAHIPTQGDFGLSNFRPITVTGGLATGLEGAITINVTYTNPTK